jgi:hypothetical protein
MISKHKDIKYQIYKSDIIKNHQEELITTINEIAHKLKFYFKSDDTTWIYSNYNFFQVSSCNLICYNLFIDLKKIIRSYINHDRPIWFQAWLNFHMPNEVLNWHNHHWPTHGYITIDGKKTKTVFEEYEIMNEDGNIYIGPGYKKHKVEVLEPFTTPRITIGFDVSENDNIMNKGLSFIPID